MRKAARKAASAAVRSGPAQTKKRDESLYHKGSCPMRKIDRPDEADWKPGDYWFADVSGQRHTYPALWACFPDGSLIHLPLEPMPAGVLQQPSWKFDGNRERPTLTPSVHVIGHWHGWLRAGRMESV